MRRQAAAEEEARPAQPVEPCSQGCGRLLRHWIDHFITELASEHRADLSHFLGRCPQPVEPRKQRGVQGGGNCRQWGRSQHRRNLVLAANAL